MNAQRQFCEKEGHPRTFMIAEVDGVPVAALSVFMKRRLADIEGAYTAPEYRRHGLFQRLVDYVLCELRKDSFRTVTVQANNKWVVRRTASCVPPVS